jgi:DNA mismatch repair protein MutS
VSDLARGNRTAETPPKASRTPLMRQYARIKQDHPDAFLFYRLGDFYEMFFDDAIRGAALLGLTLTSRNKHDRDAIPMCGVPWHQRDTYVARLLRLGHKVAICDQLEEPSAAKPLVDRGVTEVLTPGSIVVDSLLEPAANNFLAALWPTEETLGICLLDASTGEIKLAEPSWDDIGALLSRFHVAEWVTPNTAEVGADQSQRLDGALRGLPGARSVVSAASYVPTHDLLERLRLDPMDAATRLQTALKAAAAALGYLDRVQGRRVLAWAHVETWREEEVLRYDAPTARHLELFRPQPGGEERHTLWFHINRSVTALGARRLRAWIERPLADLEPIRRRHAAVRRWVEAGVTRARFRDELRSFPDLERLNARIAASKATPRDLGALRDALSRLPVIQLTLDGLDEPMFRDACAALGGVPALEQRLRQALTEEPPPTSQEGGVIRPGYDAHRDHLSELTRSGKRWIAELETSERSRTGIPSLKVGYNRVFGYYLEVTRPHLVKVPDDYERRQTLTTAERFITPDLKVKEGEVLGAEEKLKAREHELFIALREEAARFLPELQAAGTALATLDAEATLAEAAAHYDWAEPHMNDSDRIVLESARHPVVERLLEQGDFVPNHCRLDGSNRQILLLTGPNMGGKSTYLRQLALIVLLAQAGSFVPAARAEIGIVDRLFTRVGASDRLGAGESTFLVEMRETADILRSATPRSLVLLDEVGRGTSTYDGLALAWAVTEHLHATHGPRPRTLFATHYHELIQLADRLSRLVNVHVSVQERNDEVVFLHRIAEGPADRSYGIHVARLAGLPGGVVERASALLAQFESERTAPRGVRGVAVGARGRNLRDQTQLWPPSAIHPLLEELRQIDPESITPLEALQRLAEWKARWGLRGAESKQPAGPPASG